MNEWMKTAIQFFKESYAELSKVTWLSRREAVASTLIVVILVIIVSIYVGFIDLILARILGIIL